MHTGVESEFKLRARHRLEPAAVDAALRELAVVVTTSGHAKLGDIYLDDAGLSLRTAGLGLRLRVVHGTCTITCKGPGERRGSLFVRTEASAPWPAPTTPRTAADLPPALRDLVEPLLLQRPLVPILRLQTERDIRVLEADGVAIGEVAIDATEAHGGGEVVRFAELEVEALDDLAACERIAEALQARLDLTPAPDDKPTHALHRLGRTTPRRTDDGIQGRLRAHLLAVQLGESAVRARTDATAVHELRIAVRRLAVATTAVPDIWSAGETDWLQKHLRAFARELGRVRDLDVLGAELPRLLADAPTAVAEGVADLLAAAGQARSRALAHLLAWLQSPQRLADAQRCSDLLRATPDPTPIRAEVATTRLGEVRAHWQRVAAAAVHSPTPRHLHAARIATRQLRHLAQELDQALGGALQKPIRQLQRLQTALGELGDAMAMQRVLATLLDDPSLASSPRVAAALGSALQRLHDAAGPATERAAKALQRARRRRFLRPDPA